MIARFTSSKWLKTGIFSGLHKGRLTSAPGSNTLDVMNEHSKETPLSNPNSDTEQKPLRIGIIVDTANLYFSARQQLGGKINYSLLHEMAVQGREVDRAICYLTESGNGGCSGFLRSLRELGFETKLKHVTYRENGTVRGNWDVGMTIDATDMMDDIDVLVIASGNGNLADLAAYARMECNVRVEVIGVESTISKRLLELASVVRTLNRTHLVDGTL